jgi:crotonobetainyl-CoA:carnitine CoA-transferase CaiB-like acyl-CoA transferase
MRPLVGKRILDLSRLLPGPFTTLVLADLGATVDKFEDLGSGDYLRHLMPTGFDLLNRGK